MGGGHGLCSHAASHPPPDCDDPEDQQQEEEDDLSHPTLSKTQHDVLPPGERSCQQDQEVLLRAIASGSQLSSRLFHVAS